MVQIPLICQKIKANLISHDMKKNVIESLNYQVNQHVI